MAWLLLAVAVLSNVTSNIMFKVAMRSLPTERDLGAMLRFALNPFLVTGFAACATLLVCYLLALRSLGLMVSYTVVISMSLVGITVVSVFVLHEGVSGRALAGIGLVLAGIALLTTSPAAA